MEQSSSDESVLKKNVRHGSGRVPNVRRSTKGPLDVENSPLTSDPLSPTPSVFHTPTQTPHTGSSTQQLLSPTSLTASQSQFSPTAASHHPRGSPRTRSPRLPSPQPSSLSSNPSFRTAHSTLTPVQSTLTTKDFSYLLRPEIYHPLTLLDVPPPFRQSTSQPSPSTPLTTLLATGSYRSAAILAAAQLTSSSNPLLPSDHVTIFSLFYTRLSSLTLCNATPLAAQEVKALEDLNSSYYRDEETNSHLVPWELRVLAVRLQGMGFNDARRGVMGYYDLARDCRLSLTTQKRRLAAADPPPEEEAASIEAEIAKQTARLEDLGLRVASALIEMEDLSGASRHLKTLHSSSSSSPKRDANLALLYLYLGDIDAARKAISSHPSAESESETGRKTREEQIITALSAMGDAEYDKAVTIWEDLITSSSSSSSSSKSKSTSAEGDHEDDDLPMFEQNLAVSLLYLGRLDDARKILESLINHPHSFHALTFNLSTIYELCTERSRALKIGLAERVAEMQLVSDTMGKDGRVGKDGIGKEKVNADFKL